MKSLNQFLNDYLQTYYFVSFDYMENRIGKNKINKFNPKCIFYLNTLHIPSYMIDCTTFTLDNTN